MPTEDTEAYEVTHTPRATDRDWLALRQWCRRTLDVVREHARAYPEAATRLEALEPHLATLSAYCEQCMLPLVERLHALDVKLEAHIAEDAKANG